MNTERREAICSLLREKEHVSMAELREMFPEVSNMTIHRDLDALAQQGLLIKVRGGARAARYSTEPLFDIRSKTNAGGKRTIADKALPLLKERSSIFLDGGTTGLMLARQMPDMELTVTTTAPGIAMELCRLSKVTINLCGGNVSKANLVCSGQSTLEQLERINIDAAFIGTSGLSEKAAFVCGQESDMLVKRKALQRAQTRVVLCDSSKFGCLLPFTFADWGEADILITDRPLPEPLERAARQARITVL